MFMEVVVSDNDAIVLGRLVAHLLEWAWDIRRRPVRREKMLRAEGVDYLLYGEPRAI